jgi:tRNA nucleotidyltransferase (CCA-adding enzyme)
MRYAALLHDVGKPDTRTTDDKGQDHFKGHAKVSEKIAGEVLKRLRMDNDTIRDVKTIVLWHDFGLKGDITRKSVRKMLSSMGKEYFDSYVQIKRADIKGQSDYGADESLGYLAQIISFHDEIIEEGNALAISDLAISGKDLINMGIKPGPEMGEILRDLLDKVIEEPALNTSEALTRLVSER